MLQWDNYVEKSPYALKHHCFLKIDKPVFKNMHKDSFKLFRSLMQFIDCAVLDIQTAQYTPQMIILSFMYLILGIKIADFSHDKIHRLFPRTSHYLIDRDRDNPYNPYNDLFGDFVMESFNLTLSELLPTVQYTATFFNITFTYEKPLQNREEE